MKTIHISKLTYYNYTINILNSLKQNWENSSFNCLGDPKEKNLFLYIHGCDAKYCTKNGDIFYAKSGNIVYTPINCEYSVKFYNFEKEHHTIGVNFFLYDDNNQPFILDKNISIFKTSDKNYRFLFEKICDENKSTIPNKNRMKAAFYDIMANLCDEQYQNSHLGKYAVISKGIRYLQTCTTNDISIKEIALMCNVSECYFRRLFKEFSGMSPVEYLTRNKIHKAKTYLQYDNISIAEIASLSGFSDCSYFTKKFHEYTGKTPGEYRQSQKT